jgi:hypothetical protein
MPFKKLQTIDVGSIAAGATAERSWTSDGDYTIKRIFFVEKAGASIYKVEVTFRKDGEAYAMDYVPAIVLSHLNNLNPELGIELKRDQKIVFGFKNNETAARDLYVVMELWA